MSGPWVHHRRGKPRHYKPPDEQDRELINDEEARLVDEYLSTLDRGVAEEIYPKGWSFSSPTVYCGILAAIAIIATIWVLYVTGVFAEKEMTTTMAPVGPTLSPVAPPEPSCSICVPGIPGVQLGMCKSR